MFSGIAVILGLSSLIIIHELGHFLAAKYFNVYVEEFGFGIPPRMIGKRFGETLVSLNWLPIGGFVKVFGLGGDKEVKRDLPHNRNFNYQPLWKRSIIIAAGVCMNFILGWLLFSAVYMIGIPQSLFITDVKPNSIAAAAHLQGGDQLVDFIQVKDFVHFVDANKGKEVMLHIKRGAEDMSLPIMPRIDVPTGEGNLGIYLVESGFPQAGIITSLKEGFMTALQMSGAIFVSLFELLIGVFTHIGILEKFVGPVGIVKTAVETTRMGLPYFLQLVGMLSLNLAVFNAIPIPALDGGRLFFLLIEKMKGSPIKQKTETIINGIGFSFLIMLILVITAKDIIRIL